MLTLENLLHIAIERGASDLHLTAGLPPQLRIDGLITSINYDILMPEIIKTLIYDVLSEEQIKKFETENELDFSFGIKELSRFRVNVYRQRGCISVAIRIIPYKIPSIEELGLPAIIKKLGEKPRGLILVTGPTGSGKTTTLATLIEQINNQRRCHIITLEDPIEYLFHHKKAIINQREIYKDTHSFAQGLKYILRQDPDVILIGEMRDLETIQAALTISETGHLVLASLHTPNTIQSINRIVDVFPPYQQHQVRLQLSFILEGILAQQLLTKCNEKGRIVAVEILIPTPAIRNLIREDKLHQIYSCLQTGYQYGMQTMNYALAQLWLKGLVSYEEIISRTSDLQELQEIIKKHKK